jgi:hypothetical protein
MRLGSSDEAGQGWPEVAQSNFDGPEGASSMYIAKGPAKGSTSRKPCKDVSTGVFPQHHVSSRFPVF